MNPLQCPIHGVWLIVWRKFVLILPCCNFLSHVNHDCNSLADGLAKAGAIRTSLELDV